MFFNILRVGTLAKRTFVSAVGDFFSTVLAAAFAVGIFAVVLWASGFFGLFGGPAGFSSGDLDDNTPPEREAVDVVPDPPQPERPWVCYWDATMNENWHDDVACSNGSRSIRPELLTDGPLSLRTTC